MGPFDIPRLNWDNYLGNKAVAGAYQDLNSLTLRTIALHSLSLVPRVRRSFYCAWRSAIHIFVDEQSPNVHHALAHELLHGILVEEGYHKLAARLPNSVQSILSNELQHPEIFRRMEGYGLDMAPYWSDWATELKHGVTEMKLSRDPYAGFGHFPRIFTWFFFRHVSQPYLAEYRDFDPAVFHSAKKAYEDTRGIGMGDPITHRESIEQFKGRWCEYCDRHLPKDSFGVDLVARISGSAIAPLIDFERGRPGSEIIALLEINGLRMR